MRLKTSLSLLMVFVALGLGVLAEAARPVHWFDCSVCHTAGVSTTSLGGNNICVQCHKPSPTTTTFVDGNGYRPHGVFSVNDASDALGSASKLTLTPTAQTSHYWASTKDVVEAAGAMAPTAALYRSRYGISNGKVTCTRCHDPHLNQNQANPDAASNKLLRLSNPNAMCLDCHRPWNVGNADHGLGTHPMVTDYPTFAAANLDKYKAVIYNASTLVLSTNIDKGGVRLVYNSTSAEYDISCSSCHGIHFVDSNTSTDDGVAQAQATNTGYTTGLTTGDGELLLGDGPGRTDADSAIQAQLRSNICQTCHVYIKHGDVNGNDNSMFAGCLDCHGGHVYHATNPNYFVLRKSVENIFVPKVGVIANAVGLEFTSTTAPWANADGTGYCQGCHTLTFPHNGKVSATYGKDGCINCHFHNNENGSFVADCSACHGFPPTLDAEGMGTLGGYAVDIDNNRSYRYTDITNTTLRAEFKDETLTPHKRHAAGGSDYSLACDNCHSQTFAGTNTHLDGDFQNVDFGALGGGSATYTNFSDTNPGTCSSVYCHSNGNAGDPVYASINWKNTAGTIAGCTACHGNTAETMNSSNKKNSTSHQKHLGQGSLSKSYGCTICHEGTASDGNTLVASAKLLGGVHVNGQSDVDFATSGGALYNALSGGSFTDGANTCANVYCHSDGKGNYAAPDWDSAASGACGTCHDVPPTSGSHTAHISATGANIACAGCHGAGANDGTHAAHIDAAISVTAGVCDSCHAVDGADGSSTPTWGNGATAVCDACHAGTATTVYTDAGSTVRTAPAKGNFFSAGHGKTTANGGSTPPNIGCTGCHGTTVDAAHMGAGSTDRLKTVNGQVYATATPNAFCGACHDGGSSNEKAHYATTGASDDGTKCNYCHDPHGVAGYDAMLLSVIQGTAIATFSDKTLRASYVKDTTFDGVCQVCHASADVRRFNQTTYSGSHGGVHNCIECHPHGSDPAFKPVCYACHGGGTTVGDEKNYWPDTSTGVDENTAGKHAVHMEKLSMEVYGEQYNTALLTTTGNGTADAKQRVLCEFCHAAVVNDDDHTDAGTAEVFVATVNTASARFAKPIWDKNAADLGASYNSAADTCANVACHNNILTTDGTYGWYDAGTTACIMCHHNVTSNLNLSGKVHNQHMSASSMYGIVISCSSCHESGAAWGTPGTKPSSGHLNGTFSVVKDSSFPHFTYTGNWATGGSFGTCGTNDCHNNGQDGTPYNANTGGYNWGGDVGFGCLICHMWIGITSNGHAAHSSTIITGSISCSKCHNGSGMDALHINRIVNLQPGMNYNSATYNSTQLTTVGATNNLGKCNTTTCHQDGNGTISPTPLWNVPASETCSLCHAGVPSTGSHPTHVRSDQIPTMYNGAGIADATTTEYSFLCSNCHGNSLSTHMNSTVNVLNVGYNNPSAGRCGITLCHSDGAITPVYNSSPAWGGTWASVGHSDVCAGCHGNSPTTNAHQSHEVGFHFDAVYSGTSGFLPILDADAVPPGMTYANKDEIRGHGGRLDDNVTSTSTVIGCYVCHNATVTVWYNDKNSTCGTCHDGTDTALQGGMVVSDKTKHVNGVRDVQFFKQKIRSKAQVRDELLYNSATPTSFWTDIEELNQSWIRTNGYKADDGSSYDESPDTLYNTGVFDNGSGSIGGSAANPTCLVSCHLINQTIADNSLDKEPVGWADEGRMCIDCHTRLPK